MGWDNGGDVLPCFEVNQTSAFSIARSSVRIVPCEGHDLRGRHAEGARAALEPAAQRRHDDEDLPAEPAARQSADVRGVPHDERPPRESARHNRL